MWEAIKPIFAGFGIFSIIVVIMVWVSSSIVDIKKEELKKEIEHLEKRIEKLEIVNQKV